MVSFVLLRCMAEWSSHSVLTRSLRIGFLLPSRSKPSSRHIVCLVWCLKKRETPPIDWESTLWMSIRASIQRWLTLSSWSTMLSSFWRSKLIVDAIVKSKCSTDLLSHGGQPRQRSRADQQPCDPWTYWSENKTLMVWVLWFQFSQLF